MKTALLILLLAVGARAAEVTSYCHCKICCGESGQPTAGGMMPLEGITVAGPSWIPLGTRVYIQGVGWRIVQDRTAKRFNGVWDVYVNSHRRAKRFGRKELAIRIKAK